jgi:hypothetical protein
VLLAQVDLLLHGSLDDVAAHPDATLIDLALADIEPLFRNRDALLAIRADGLCPSRGGRSRDAGPGLRRRGRGTDWSSSDVAGCPGDAGRAEMLVRCIATVPTLFTPGSLAMVEIDRALIVENVDDAIRLGLFSPPVTRVPPRRMPCPEPDGLYRKGYGRFAGYRETSRRREVLPCGQNSACVVAIVAPSGWGSCDGVTPAVGDCPPPDTSPDSGHTLPGPAPRPHAAA